ncbi:MAG: hypothetical protein FJ279_38480, partial [Planctomycetes bacterium]|nr:hypothetical protein [Planctomycetota bacterium]
MVSCTEFIPAYSELFKFLEQTGGKAAVVRYWESLSDAYLGELRKRAAAKGLAGCLEWWDEALREETTDYQLALDEAQGVFQIIMRRCPSKGLLLESPHLQPYPAYCEHCDTLYRRALEPLGFEYEVDFSRCDSAACTRTVRLKGKRAAGIAVQSRSTVFAYPNADPYDRGNL